MLDGLAAFASLIPTPPQRAQVYLQIREAQQMSLPFVYLGYWIDGCRKMSYKSRFSPLELYVDGQWQQHKTTQSCAPDAAAVVSLLEPQHD